MTEKSIRSSGPDELRQRAEEIARTRELGDLDALSRDEIRTLVHELQVHQIELEMQNQTLRQAEVELAASHARYFDLYDLAPVGYLTLSDASIITEANLTATQLLGVPRDSLFRKPLTGFIHPEDQDAYYLLRKRLAASGAPQATELRLVKGGGDFFWVRFKATAPQDMDPVPVTRVVISDISDRKRMEESLRESEERFRRLLQDVPAVAVQGYGADGTTRYWNRASEQLYGYTAEEAIGRNLGELIIPPEARAMVAETFRKMAATGHPMPAAELSRVRRDGSRVAVLSSLSVVQVPGRPPELFCIDVDISERKAVEDAQVFLLGRPEADEAFFPSLARYLAERLRMEYVRIDRLVGDDLEAVRVAGQCDDDLAAEFTYTLQDTPCGAVGGKTVCCFTHDVRSVFPRDPLLRELGAESYVGITLLDSLEQPIGLITGAGRRPLSNPWLAETLLRLVAVRAGAELERRQAEEERSRMEERMAQVQRLEALGYLAGGISHNLSNVLAAILGHASARETATTGAKDREAFQAICRACERGRDVLDSLLRFARPSLPARAPLDLNHVLGELRRLLDHTAPKRVSVVESYSEAPAWVHGSAVGLSHAFMDLCVNALSAMPEGGVLTLRSAVTDDRWVDVEIEDTGAGMPPEILAHALEPFCTSRPGKGTGLGLSMTYGTVQAHGGTLDIASRPGQGTRVRIRLPRIAAPASHAALPEPPRAIDALQVLLVEDDELVRLSTANQLEISGCRPTAAQGGQEALDLLAAGFRPDVVLLDLNMPGMDGLETLRRLRITHPDLPVIIASGQPNIEEWEGLDQPHVDALPKPFTMKELKEKLARMVPPR